MTYQDMSDTYRDMAARSRQMLFAIGWKISVENAEATMP